MTDSWLGGCWALAAVQYTGVEYAWHLNAAFNGIHRSGLWPFFNQDVHAAALLESIAVRPDHVSRTEEFLEDIAD